jgi:iron(III) transport system permease protein
VLLLVPVAFLIIVPGIEVISTSLQHGGSISLYNWQRVLSGPMARVLFYKPLLNTLALSAGMTVLSLALGGFLAWLVVRTDLPLKHLIERIGIIPYVIPSWVISLSWITLFANSRHFGGYPGLLESFFGTQTPLAISYGIFPIIMTLSMHYFPYTFLLTSAALRSVDSHLEEIGETLGANRLQILLKVTFPIIIPSLLSAFILTFSKGLGTFGVPAFLGPPVRFHVLSTVIYAMLNTSSTGDAYTLAIITTLFGALAIYMNVKLTSARRRFTTLTGKGVRMKVLPLGRLRWPIASLVFAFILATAILPVVVLLWQSLMFYPGDFSLRNLTSHFWVGQAVPALGDAGEPGVLRNPSILRATWNSLRLSVIAGAVSGVLGFMVGYAVVKMRGSLLSKTLDQFSFLPYLMPELPFAATYLVMFAHPIGPIPALYGTMALLVVVSVVKRLPYSSRTGISAMMQISKELEESAIMLGARWWRRFRKIVLPLGRSGFLAGFLLTFITIMRELSLIILLVTPRTEVLPTMIFRYAEQAIPQFTNALALVIVVMSVGVYFLVQSVQKVDMFGSSE